MTSPGGSISNTGKFRIGSALLLSALAAGGGVLLAQSTPFTVTTIAQFNEPWAMAFLPAGGGLVTEKRGVLKLVKADGRQFDVSGVPAVAYGGQGGLGDVALHPDFPNNQLVYISYAEAGGGRSGAAVARARFEESDSGGALRDLAVIWRQEPKVSGGGHFGHRIAFGDDGYLFISSGERQAFDPAQDMNQNLGKILRLRDDGSVPTDNPFVAQGGITAQIWSLGHRNPLGLAMDGDGQLWNTEMGPQGGDELNRVQRGANYGWPLVSNGSHYGGGDIPDHPTRPEFAAPAVFWNPVISPSSLQFYNGAEFPDWQGDAFIGGLSSQALVRIEFDGNGGATEAQRFNMGERIRAVEQGPDGALWLLEDGANGRLLRLNRKPK
jgi:glucose/arabinose dehydrogenase